MLERNSNQQKDLIHKITTNTIRWCIQHRVTKIIIGDIADIARNAKEVNSFLRVIIVIHLLDTQNKS